MTSTFRFLAIAGAFTLTLGATLSFAQQDNVTIKRTVGDFYDITISGQRAGDFAEVQMLRTETHRFLFNGPAGNHPSLAIYALVVSDGDANARSNYSMTFQEQLPGLIYSISYCVTENYEDFVQGNCAFSDSLLLDNYNRVYDSHHDDGYYFGVDLTDSSIASQAEDTITIRNLKVEGSEDLFWATFQWNRRNLKFELKEAEPES